MLLPGLGHRRASNPAEGPIFSPLCSEEEQEGQCHYKIIHVHVSKQTVWNRLHRDSMRSQCPLVWNCAHRPVLCNSTGICQRTPELAGLPLGSCSLRTRAGSQWAHVRDASLETSWQMLYCLQHYALDVVYDSGRRWIHAWLQCIVELWQSSSLLCCAPHTEEQQPVLLLGSCLPLALSSSPHVTAQLLVSSSLFWNWNSKLSCNSI